MFLTGPSIHLGVAPAFALRYGDVPAGFIVFPTWSVEGPGIAEAIKRSYETHHALYPNHLFHFICNSPVEAELLAAAGLPTTFLNKNFTVSDMIFRPLGDGTNEFDAIYNARFVSAKRHWLAAKIPRVGYVSYVEPGRDREFQRLLAATLELNPNHVLLNKVRRSRPVMMSRPEVNSALDRGAVGLVLSEEEGSSYASMEYMLAGMPVVSTLSTGGRDVHFDSEYCIVCEPNEDAVRAAVALLRAKNFSRDYVRQRTLDRIQPERERFLALADSMIAKLGGEPHFAGKPWPFTETSGVRWRPIDRHIAAFARAARIALAERLGLQPELVEDMQLEDTELRPVLAVVRDKRGCKLLVFGCGNDSRFWEQVNRGGTTAFLEDNPEWANKVRPTLEQAVVYLVRYGTMQFAWRWLLSRPAWLDMVLPAAVREVQWDVILVDGPAGYGWYKPGRMKAIYAASKLVAPGGRVFIHDAHRPAERAFASRYLGDSRLFVEARGHTLIKGYAF
ncbi:MAG: hypothetical protein ABIO40_12245 [Devosia sp.]